MVWVSDETIKLYREMNASYLALTTAVTMMARDMRRIERRMEAMARTTQESLDAVRETAGFVASLAKLVAELRDKVTEVASQAGLSAEDQGKIDAIFDEAHAASSAAASALIQNPKSNDSTAQPASDPGPAPEPQQ